MSPVPASQETAASRDKKQGAVVSAPTRSSALADNSQQKGQAALFALSRGRKEGEVEGDVIP